MLKGHLGKALQVLLAVILCQAAGALGALFTVNSVDSWYVTLNKPAFNPPNWIFGPVWTTLYTMMGIALILVWWKRGDCPAARTALRLFAVQWILNAAWTPVFFGAHLLFPAFLIIVCLDLAIAATIAAFSACSRPAALLLVPYLFWVLFASALNYSLWRLN